MTRRRALLSVSDKSNIAALGRALVERGWELVSTGGTARTLRDADLPVMDVSDVTGHPEMMDGRVKTLHPAVHAGLLARRHRNDDLEALDEQGYQPIDLVVVNLYPFRETVEAGDVSVDEAMEQVDIGGPTLIRAAAKNHRYVWVVVDPADYDRVVEALDTVGGAPGEAGTDAGEGVPGAGGLELRRELATKVFRHVSAYDRAVAKYLEEGAPVEEAATEGESTRRGEEDGGAGWEPGLSLGLRRVQTLRYGENPDQEAAFYGFEGDGTERAGLVGLEQHHGKALSYNNLLDLDGALLCLSPFAFSHRPAVCIIKHTTPAGLAVGDTLVEAYRRALRTDPMSSFGSVISLNRRVDEATAEALNELFVECVVAPGYSEEAMSVLTTKKNIRVLTLPDPDDAPRFLADHGRRPRARVFRSVYGGMLAQTPPAPPFYGTEEGKSGSWSVATEREPTPEEWDDLRFAWAAVFGVKSNAILLARNGATLGIGAGQMSRVDASKIAVRKAADADLDLQGAVLASDAFFPFRDGVDAAAEAGVEAIVQPGGSKRDPEVVEAADEHGIAMVLTGRRLFRH